MLGIGLLFILSLVTFILLAGLFSLEEKREKRLFLAQFRARLDSILDQATRILSSRLRYLGRHIIKLSWYYGIHKALRVILTGLIKVYDFLEIAFVRNRDRARTIKVEKRSLQQTESHLSQMAEHKVSTALTETQKKRLLQKKLERG